MAHLHAGLAEVIVVDDHDDEVLRIGDRDGGEPAKPHQLLAVAGDHDHGAIRLRLRETKPDQRGRAHGAPEIIVSIVVTGGMHVVAWRAEAGNDQEAVSPGEQAGYDLAAIELALSHALTTSWRRGDAATTVPRPAARTRTQALRPTRPFRSDRAASRRASRGSPSRRAPAPWQAPSAPARD